MSEMITNGMSALRRYEYLITKMKFPVSIIPTFVALSKVFVHIGLVLVVIIMFIGFGFYPDIYYLQIIYYMFVMFLFFTAWSLLSSPLATISKDFENLVSSFIIAVFWLSAVIWDSSGVQNVYFKWFLKFNPVTYIVNGYRDAFIYKVWFFEKAETLYFGVVLFIMIILALVTYNKLRKDIPDVL